MLRLLGRNSGQALIQVIAVVAGMGMLFYLISDVTGRHRSVVLANADQVQLRIALQSTADYAIYGLKQRWCFSDQLLKDGNCTLEHPASTERLIMSPEGMQYVRQALAANPPGLTLSYPAENVILSSFEKQFEISSMTPAHPLYVVLQGLKKADIESVRVRFERDLNPSTPRSGSEVFVHVRVTLLDDEQKDVKSLVQNISVHPREVGMFALITPGSLRMDKNYDEQPEPGDAVFHQFASAEEVPGQGLVFLSPVFVNRDMHLPLAPDRSKSKGAYAAVTFADRVILGEGRLFERGLAYAPKEAGALGERSWSDNRSFGGLQKGIENDGARDPGLDAFVAMKPVTETGGSASDLMAQCIGNNLKRSNLGSIMESSLFAAPRSGNTVEDSTYRIGLTEVNELNPQPPARSQISIDKDWDDAKILSPKGTIEDAIVRLDVDGGGGDRRAVIYLRPESVVQFKVPVITRELKSGGGSMGGSTGGGTTGGSTGGGSTGGADGGSNGGGTTGGSTGGGSTGGGSTGGSTGGGSTGGGSTGGGSTGGGSTGGGSTGGGSTGGGSTGGGSTGGGSTGGADGGTTGGSTGGGSTGGADGGSNGGGTTGGSTGGGSTGGGSTGGSTGGGGGGPQYNYDVEDMIITVSLKNVIKEGYLQLDKADLQIKIENPGALGTKYSPTPLSFKIRAYDLSTYYYYELLDEDDRADLSAHLDYVFDKNTWSYEPPSGFLRKSKWGPDVPIQATEPNTNYAKLSDDCFKASGTQKGGMAFGSAGWDQSFASVTRPSWNFAGQGNESAPANANDPLLDNFSFHGTNAKAGVAVEFNVRSIVKTCRIESTADFVTGFLTCDKLIIEPRSTPLRIIGTFIVGKLEIHPSAYKAGITWSSVYYPQATQELRAQKVLKRKSDPNVPCSDESSKESPPWHPIPSIQEVADRFACNTISLRARAKPFQWTAVDPDCGKPAGASNTICKNRMVNFIVVGHSEEME